MILYGGKNTAATTINFMRLNLPCACMLIISVSCLAISSHCLLLLLLLVHLKYSMESQCCLFDGYKMVKTFGFPNVIRMTMTNNVQFHSVMFLRSSTTVDYSTYIFIRYAFMFCCYFIFNPIWSVRIDNHI